MQDLGRLFGAAESPERCLTFVTEVSDPDVELSWQPAAMSGVAAGLRARGMASDSQSASWRWSRRHHRRARAARVARGGCAPDGARGRTAAVDRAQPSSACTMTSCWGKVSGRARARPSCVIEPQRRARSRWRRSALWGKSATGPPQPPRSSQAGTLAGVHARVRDAVLTTLFSENRLCPCCRRRGAAPTFPRRRSAAAACAPLDRASHRVDQAAGRCHCTRQATAPRRCRSTSARREGVLARTGNRHAAHDGLANLLHGLPHVQRTGGRSGPDLSGIRNTRRRAPAAHASSPTTRSRPVRVYNGADTRRTHHPRTPRSEGPTA